MASEQSVVQYFVDQISSVGDVRFRKMFGEYAVYVGNKVVALVCDNRVFVKKTIKGLEFAGPIEEAPPYSGAKPSLVVDEKLDDRNWLKELIQITYDELPEPKPKKKKKA